MNPSDTLNSSSSTIPTANSRRPSVKPPKIPSAADHCHMCDCTFSFSNKKKICTVCQLPVCKDHSGGAKANDERRVCDLCEKEKLYLRSGGINREIKENLSRNLRNSTIERDEKVNQLAKLNAKIKQYETQIKSMKDKFADNSKKIHDKIQQEKERNEKADENIIILNRDIEKAQVLVNETEGKLTKAQADLKNVKFDEGILQEENSTYFEELSELLKFIKTQVPVKIIKRFVCNICFRKIQYSFKNMFEESDMALPSRISIANREEMIRRPCCCLLF